MTLPIELCYDAAASHYDGWVWQAIWAALEVPWIVARLEDVRVDCALDVGTGTGNYVPHLNRVSSHTVAVDSSASMLALATKRLGAGGRGLLADARALPLDDASVDVAVAARVVSHMAGLGTFVDEMARVIRPGGLLLVADIDARHHYSGTTLPSDLGRLSVETHKRTLTEIRNGLQSQGQFVVEAVRLVRHRDIPPDLRAQVRHQPDGRPLAFQIAARRR